MLNIKVFTGEAADGCEQFEAEFVSYFSDDSYGPPALIAPKDGRAPTAKPGDRVLYINTRFVPLVLIQRGEDSE